MSEAMLARGQQVEIVGVPTSVPNDDYSRLSYYLSCATKAIGIDIIQDDLLDYKNAHRLSRERKDGLLKLTNDVYNPDTTVGTIFYPDQGGLCGSSDNVFYKVTQVDTILTVSHSILIGGQQTQVATIMVFKEAWLKRNYYTPIKNQMSRILFLKFGTLSISDHCSHCRGVDGNCICDHGCPIKASTKCSKVHHCDHCKGFDGICACKFGCPEEIYSKCRVEHSGIVCNGCMEPDIKGARFKCAVCDNFDLCEKCYNQGARKHNITHPFNRIDRVGSSLVYLEPRQHPKPNFVTPPYATGNKNGFAKGDAVKIIGLKAKNMNGVSGVVERDAPMPGGRIQIRLREREPGTLKCIKPENLKKIQTFQSGQVVALTGLENKSMNGITGMVVDSSIPGGRIAVCLYEGKIVSIKSENLVMVVDILD